MGSHQSPESGNPHRTGIKENPSLGLLGLQTRVASQHQGQHQGVGAGTGGGLGPGNNGGAWQRACIRPRCTASRISWAWGYRQ